MDIIIIALVCSQLGVPDHANCLVATATHTDQVEMTANSIEGCQFNGMAALADIVSRGIWHVDMRTEYVKVMCVLPSQLENHKAG